MHFSIACVLVKFIVLCTTKNGIVTSIVMLMIGKVVFIISHVGSKLCLSTRCDISSELSIWTSISDGTTGGASQAQFLSSHWAILMNFHLF